MRPTPAPLLVVATLAGCHGTIASPDEYASEYARVSCAIGARCGGLGRSELAECEREAPAAIMRFMAPMRASVAAGRLAFDGAAARRCIDHLEEVDCNFSGAPGWAEDCDATFRGRVAVGGACFDRAECGEGWCDEKAAACGGVCRAGGVEGSACETRATCAAGLFCDGSHCRPRLGAGASCRTGSECREGFVCAGARFFGQGGTCVERPAGVAGDPCESGLIGDSCAAGFLCTEGRCVARVGAGAPCDSQSVCADGFACRASAGGGRACTPWLDVGDACMYEQGASACPEDLTCDATEHRCRSTGGGVGAPCASATDCQAHFGPELFCDAASGRCAVRPELGEACTPAAGGANPCARGSCQPSTGICAPDCT